MKKKIIVVGAGPGGLTAAMLLARRGFDVTVFESASSVGGRNTGLKVGPYTFDVGPTFLMMDFVLKEVFQAAGRRVEDYLSLIPLDPLYRLIFDDREIEMTSDHGRMRREIERHFPGNGPGYDRFLKEEGKRFKALMPCLTRDYSSLASFLSPTLARAIPQLGLGKSVFQNLSRYFNDEKLVLSFTFQSKYLGMSAWECPALFSMLPYVEHAFGIYHVKGGLHKISEAMARVVEEWGGRVHLKTPVKTLLFEGDAVTGVELENGEREKADAVVLNADFGHAMSRLVPPERQGRYAPGPLKKRDFSCSTFMMYLGVNQRIPMNHHTVVFARDYKRNVRQVFRDKVLSGDDFSFYVHNASVTDPTLAPEGKSALYLLVPVPNQKSGLDWEREKGPFREKLLRRVEERTPLKGLSSLIEEERIITPADWENRQIYLGATFNLSHRFSQMLYFRPHNEFEEFKNCYLTGGGTHPGSGLPVIYESARISSDLICRKFNVPVPPSPGR